MDEGTQRRLAAVLAADVVGYSSLMGADEAGTLAALRHWRAELFEPTISRNNGNVVKNMGDGWLVEFESAGDAVACAIEVQEKLSDHEILKLRIGLHIGDITHADSDIYGDGVNIAARLQAAAAPGDILISDVVHHSLDGRLGGIFQKKPLLKLKNIERAMAAYSWRDAPTEPNIIDESGKKAPTQQLNISLGFNDLELKAGDNEVALLCDGVNEAIRAALANQAGFLLLTDTDKADMVIEGSMQSVGARYRAVIHLIDKNNQKSIKSEKFDGVIADLFEAEDELALRICTSIRFAAFAYEASALEKADRPMEEQESSVIRVYAGGLVSDLKYEEWVEARRLLEVVLERDPDDSSALAMAGMSCTVEPNCGWRSPTPGDCEQAIRYLRKAVRINPSSDFAHTILSLALLELAEDHTGALFTAERLMEIAPHYAQGQMAHSAAMIYNGQVEEGTDLALKAIEPLKGRQLFSYNAAYLMLGLLLSQRHEEVLVWGQTVNQRIENVPRNLLLMMSAAAHLQDFKAARDCAAQLLEHHADFRLSEMRIWSLKRAGDWEHFMEGLRAAGLPE
jgi:adenylate cyclase